MLPANYNPSLKIFGLPLHGLLSDRPGYRYPGAMSLSPFVTDQSGNVVGLTAPGIARSTAQGLLEGIQAPRRVLQGEVDPMTGAMLTAGAAPVGGLLARAPAGAVGMNVFHGTPSRFAPEPGFPQGRPRLDKMGTGEGAQAYGPGFYSAERRAVADEYRQALSQGQPQVSYKGNLLSEDYGIDFFDKGFTYEDKLAREIARNRSNPAQREDYRQALIDQAKRKQSQINPDDGDIEKRIYDSYQDEIDALSKINVADIETVKPGNLYKLDIPDSDAAKLLDYDARIADQPDSVRFAIEQQLWSDAERGRSTPVGAFFKGLSDDATGYDVFTGLSNTLGSGENAAEYLRNNGVPGLRYKDAGSRGTDSASGTRNFVVWDQDVLDRTQILQRNDETFFSNAKPAAAAGGLLSAAAQKSVDRRGTADIVADHAKKLGYDVEKRGSASSGSEYLNLSIGDGDNFQTLKVRISDHELPPTYGLMHGYADYEIGPHDSGAVRGWAGVVDDLAKRAGKPTPSAAKAQLTKQEKLRRSQAEARQRAEQNRVDSQNWFEKRLEDSRFEDRAPYKQQSRDYVSLLMDERGLGDLVGKKRKKARQKIREELSRFSSEDEYLKATILSANPASAAIPGLLIGNPAITQQQMQSLLADPYGA